MADDTDDPLSNATELNDDVLRSELEHTEYTVDELEAHFSEYGEAYTADQLRVFREVESARDTPRRTATQAIDQRLDAVTRGPEQPDGSAEDMEVGVEEETDAQYESVQAAGGPDATPDLDSPEEPPRRGRGTESNVSVRTSPTGETARAGSPRTGVTHTGRVNLENVDTPEGEADLTADDVEVGSLPSPHHAAAPETVRVSIPRAMMFAGRFFEDPGTYELPYREPNGDTLQGMRVKRSLESETNPVRLDETDPMHPNYDAETAESPVGEEV